MERFDERRAEPDGEDRPVARRTTPRQWKRSSPEICRRRSVHGFRGRHPVDERAGRKGRTWQARSPIPTELPTNECGGTIQPPHRLQEQSVCPRASPPGGCCRPLDGQAGRSKRSGGDAPHRFFRIGLQNRGQLPLPSKISAGAPAGGEEEDLSLTDI